MNTLPMSVAVLALALVALGAQPSRPRATTVLQSSSAGLVGDSTIYCAVAFYGADSVSGRERIALGRIARVGVVQASGAIMVSAHPDAARRCRALLAANTLDTLPPMIDLRWRAQAFPPVLDVIP